MLESGSLGLSLSPGLESSGPGRARQLGPWAHPEAPALSPLSLRGHLRRQHCFGDRAHLDQRLLQGHAARRGCCGLLLLLGRFSRV